MTNDAHRDGPLGSVRVLAARSRTGRPVYEDLPARDAGNGLVELLASPLTAYGLARGDVIRVPDGPQSAEIVRRGGNFSIALYPGAAGLDPAELHRLDSTLVNRFGGMVETHRDGVVIASVPARHGLDAIGAAFTEFRERTGIAHHYCNIHANPDDPEDDALLTWWTEPTG